MPYHAYLCQSSITGQPTSQTICSGSIASFSVGATGSGLTYQWRNRPNSASTWNNIAGAIGATYSVMVATAMNGYQYQCIVTGICGTTVTSSTAILTVAPAPNVTTQPTDQTVCENSNVTFRVRASGTGLTYQWQNSADEEAPGTYHRGHN